MTGCLGITGMEDACLVPFWDAILFFRSELLVSGRVHPGKFYMEPANHLFETENPLNHPPSFFSFHSIKTFRVPAPGWWLTLTWLLTYSRCGTSRLLARAPYTTRRTCIAILPVHGNPTTTAPGGCCLIFGVAVAPDGRLAPGFWLGTFWYNINKDLYY